MAKRKPLFSLLLLLFFFFFFFFLSLTHAADTDILRKLSKSLSPTPSGWSGPDPCKWSGINCDSSSLVTSIDLSSQSLSGSLPPDLNQLSSLKTLSFQKNQLSGAIPTFSKLTNLENIYLDTNNFTSVSPSAFYDLNSLQTLSLTDNINLEPWVVPDLSQSSSLVTLYASNVNLIGSIPDFLGSLTSLQNLRLSYNNLTGPLPISFAGSGISNLWINNQVMGLAGPIDVLGKMTQLSQAWLHKNLFTGPIPDLSNCTSLFDLQLRDNTLTGIVPPLLNSLPKLANVSLANNKLQGPFPDLKNVAKVVIGDTNNFCNPKPGPCAPQVTTLLNIAGALGYPIKLSDSWQGNDPCVDWSFITCDPQEKNITVINFAKQGFVGTISPAFADLGSLRNLFLNDNKLAGRIPDKLTSLPDLQTFDVSNNNLVGKVPTFSSKVTLKSAGNPLLGTDPPPGTDVPGTGPGGSPSTGDQEHNSSSVSAGMIAGVVIAVLVFLAVVFVVFYKCYYTKKRRHPSFGRVPTAPQNGKEMMNNGTVGGANGYGGAVSDLQSQSSGEHSDARFFEGGNIAISIEVIRHVTDSFSEKNILGRGGFGIVYKGELQDGTQIAVKRMESNMMGTKGMSEFQAEIGVLTKVRHRHLVALLGFCANGQERLLVYEYMPQGTLGQHLFDYRENGTTPLTWKQRISIALDVARGVEYLHSLAQQSFIHRDLKPTNILLGDDMRAKVADFGLVKNAPDGKYSVETRLAGTFGYLAPEYAATGRVTRKVDVYAYGVVLMELITGRKALDDSMPEENAHLVTWFRRVLINKDNVRKAIDSTLDPDDETFGSIIAVAELAGHCTARDPNQRPDMGHAVNILAPFVEQWKPSRHEEEDAYGIDLHMSLPRALERWQSNEGTSTTMTGDYNTRTMDTRTMGPDDSQSSIPSYPFERLP